MRSDVDLAAYGRNKRGGQPNPGLAANFLWTLRSFTVPRRVTSLSGLAWSKHSISQNVT